MFGSSLILCFFLQLMFSFEVTMQINIVMVLCECLLGMELDVFFMPIQLSYTTVIILTYTISFLFVPYTSVLGYSSISFICWLFSSPSFIKFLGF